MRSQKRRRWLGRKDIRLSGRVWYFLFSTSTMPVNLYFQLSQCLEIFIFNFLDISNYTPCYIQVKTKGVAKSAPISVFLPSIYNRYTGHPLVSCVHWTKMKEWCFPSQAPTLVQLTHNRHLYLEKNYPSNGENYPSNGSMHFHEGIDHIPLPTYRINYQTYIGPDLRFVKKFT